MFQWLAQVCEWLGHHRTDIGGITAAVLGSVIVLGLIFVLRPNGSQVTAENVNDSYGK